MKPIFTAQCPFKETENLIIRTVCKKRNLVAHEVWLEKIILLQNSHNRMSMGAEQIFFANNGLPFSV